MKKSWYEEMLAIELKTAGISFCREYQFDSKRKWRCDFAIPDYRVLIEVEGGTWTQGQHTRPQGYQDDCEKYSAAAMQNWRVLRFTSDMVKGIVDKKTGLLKYKAINVITSFLDGEESHASQTKQEAKAKASPDGKAEGSRPQGRRPALPKGPTEEDRCREGLSEKGEGATPRDLQGQSQDQQRRPRRQDQEATRR